MLHHEIEESRRLRSSCDCCIQSKTRCNKEKPSCRRCVRRGHPCVYSVARRAGRPRKSSQTADGDQRFSHQSEGPERHGPSYWRTSAPACLCQQNSSDILGLGEGGTNFDLANTAIAARGQDVIASPKLDFGLHLGGPFESGSLHNDPLSSIDSNSNYLLDMFQGETEESLTGHYAFTSSDRTRQDSLYTTAVSPANTQALPIDPACLGTSMEQERNTQLLTGRSDGTVPLNFSDMEKAFFEGPTLPELENMIRFVIDNDEDEAGAVNHSASHRHDSCICFCSAAINKLMILVSHPLIYRRSSQIPLDIVFLLETFICRIYESVSHCLNCRTKSSYPWTFLCISTDWVMDILRGVIQSPSSRRGAQGPSSVGIDSAEGSSIIRVGRLILDGHLQELCTRSLVKHRLSRLVSTMDKMRGQSNEWRGAALQQTVRVMMQEIHHKIESIQGMMEL